MPKTTKQEGNGATRQGTRRHDETEDETIGEYAASDYGRTKTRRRGGRAKTNGVSKKSKHALLFSLFLFARPPSRRLSLTRRPQMVPRPRGVGCAGRGGGGSFCGNDLRAYTASRVSGIDRQRSLVSLSFDRALFPYRHAARTQRDETKDGRRQNAPFLSAQFRHMPTPTTTNGDEQKRRAKTSEETRRQRTPDDMGQARPVPTHHKTRR